MLEPVALTHLNTTSVDDVDRVYGQDGGTHPITGSMFLSVGRPLDTYETVPESPSTVTFQAEQRGCSVIEINDDNTVTVLSYQHFHSMGAVVHDAYGFTQDGDTCVLWFLLLVKTSTGVTYQLLGGKVEIDATTGASSMSRHLVTSGAPYYYTGVSSAITRLALNPTTGVGAWVSERTGTGAATLLLGTLDLDSGSVSTEDLTLTEASAPGSSPNWGQGHREIWTSSAGDFGLITWSRRGSSGGSGYDKWLGTMGPAPSGIYVLSNQPSDPFSTGVNNASLTLQMGDDNRSGATFYPTNSDIGVGDATGDMDAYPVPSGYPEVDHSYEIYLLGYESYGGHAWWAFDWDISADIYITREFHSDGTEVGAWWNSGVGGGAVVMFPATGSRDRFVSFHESSGVGVWGIPVVTPTMFWSVNKIRMGGDGAYS